MEYKDLPPLPMSRAEMEEQMPITLSEIWQNKPARYAIISLAVLMVLAIVAPFLPTLWPVWATIAAIAGIVFLVMLFQIKPTP